MIRALTVRAGRAVAGRRAVELQRARVLPAWVRRVDLVAGRGINRGPDRTAIDRGFARLSNTADRGLLWFAIAAALALLGRPRAAVRGTLSLIPASILANLVGKTVFGGDRPLLTDIPVGRRLARHPSTPSFPSGHSASAAAFATGVALESPRAGALLAPLAVGVAYSRLHTGAHWLSDVVGGTVLGVAVAGAGRLIDPHVVPRHGLTADGEPVELPASPTGEGVLIIANARSGRHVRRRDPLRIIGRRLPDATIRVLGRGETVDGVLRQALAGALPPRVVGVCGGDGTVSATAGAARRAGLPLLVLPAGTFNHFARAVGAETVDAAIDALQAGGGLRVDVAEATLDGGEPVTVLNAVATGVYPDFLAERSRDEERLTKWGASLTAAARLARRLRPIDVVIGQRRTRAWSVFVSVNRNDPRLVATMQRRNLADRVLDVRVLHAGGSRVRAVASLIFGRRTSALLRTVRLMPPARRIESFTVPVLSATIRSPRGPVRVSHDGELADTSGSTRRLQVRLAPGGLTVYSLGPR